MFSVRFGARPVPLKPFLLKIKEGYFLGLSRDPGKGSPCQHCVQLWLKDRKIWCEPRELKELPIRRELIPELLAENTPHVFYEIYQDGTEVRLESIVYPHPDCICEKLDYLPPKEITKKVNFAFSPIYQLKVARFGTPDGNQWLATAVGDSPVTKHTLTAHGVSDDKDAARFKAVDEWTKKAVRADLSVRLDRGEVLPSEVLQTGNVELISKSASRPSTLEGYGVGQTKDEATLSALVNLAKVRTLKKYSNSMKSPMLIVGANNWLRTKVPFFMLQQYDLHLFFYPNSTPAWVLGLAAVSRIRVDEKPIFVFAADMDITKAMDQLFSAILAAVRPGENESVPSTTAKASKLNLWWTHWIYRCPKISLKDVLHLEPNPRNLDIWKNYFKDGQEMVNVVSVNNPLLPSQVRTVVKVQVATQEQFQNIHQITGIGTWADFSDALA